jgi:hypothetical protein
MPKWFVDKIRKHSPIVVIKTNSGIYFPAILSSTDCTQAASGGYDLYGNIVSLVRPGGAGGARLVSLTGDRPRRPRGGLCFNAGKTRQ